MSSILHHISNEFIIGGIHKAFLIDKDGDLRVFIPEIHSSNMYEVYSFGSPFNIDSNKLLSKFDILPKPMWNVPNEQAMKHEIPIHPCWVIFENNSIYRPVIMGWCGEGIMYHASNSNVNQSGYYNSNGSNSVYNGDGTTGNSNADKIFRLLISECGLTISAACGVLGNCAVENASFNPELEVTDGTSTSMGIFMFYQSGHGGTNFSNLKAHCGFYDYDTIEGQIEYLRQWFNGQFSGYGNGTLCKSQLNSVESSENGAAKAVEIFCNMFEKPGIPHMDRRKEEAKKYYNIFKDGKIENGQYNYSINQNIINYFDYLETPDGKKAKEHGPVTGTQCVELANDYIESVYGIKNNGGFGHAKDYYSGLASQYSNQFQEISYSSGTQLQAGDIISLRGVQTQYGHVAIVKSVSGNNITILEQWDGSVTVREDTFNINDGGERTIIGIARPK